MNEVIQFKIPDGMKLSHRKSQACRIKACTSQFIKASLKSDIVVHPLIKNSRTSFYGNAVPCEEFIIGHYKLIQLIGEGSMGVVYLAEDLLDKMKKKYAIKILKPEVYQNNKNAVSRFFKEVETIKRFNHPNIVKVYDFGQTNHDKLPWMAMEHFQSRNLREIIKYEFNKFSLKQKVKIILQIAQALVQAHGEDIIHRDIKPENILIDEQGQAKLSDFGIVQTPESTQTNMLKILGTPYYLAPEAFNCPKVGKQADLYSLGSVAYEFLLNTKTFEADSLVGLGFKVQAKNPIKPTKIVKTFPLKLQHILEKMLKKKTTSRFQNAQRLVEELKEVLCSGLKPRKFFHISTWNTLT